MLTDEMKKEIDAEIAMMAYRRAAVSEALKIAQRHRGWISDESVKEIAEYLDMTPDEVDAVATFYSVIRRRPVGRHVILICDSVSCWVTGYNPIREHISARLGIDLGETTSDKRFTFLPCACLGLCEQAPAMMIDEEVFGNLTPEKTDRILSRYE